MSAEVTENLKKLLVVYSNCLRRHPLITKCSSSAVSAALGDIIGQLLTQNGYEFNRTLAFALFGFFATGPLMHYFYKFLAKLFPKSTKYEQLCKLAIERLLFSPSFLLLFFYAIPLLQGQSFKFAQEKVRQSYWPALAANWKAWTLVQYINISYIPVQHQTLFGNMFALLWNVYLSVRQSK